jgi:hypothetical protein
MDESLRDRIAKKAYEKFVARGRQPGYDLDDWLEAEREFMEEVQAAETKTQKKARRTPAKRIKGLKKKMGLGS